ncbi:MAG: ABC transporter substrate-binding protein [Rhodoblastus sp.]|nr:ABC transporter substrate-binding protein [Rhodoblastus sp.]
MQKTFVALALAAGLVGGAARAEETTVKIQDYPGIGNMLYRIAASKGYCEKHGIKCQLQMIASGPLGVQALLAKSVDVAFAPPEVAINASLKGSVVKAIASGAQRNVFMLVARNDLKIPLGDNDFKAMMVAPKGMKIGVPARGSGAELQFSLMAEKAGLKPTDYTYVAVGAPNTSFGALSSKQIDASMSFEPSASICDVTKGCTTIYRGALATEPKEIAGTNGASSDMFVTQEMIEKSPKIVDGLIAAANEAEAFIQNPANFPEALKIAKTYFEFKMPKGDEVMEVSLKGAIPSYKAGVSRAALKQIAANMLEMKQIPAAFDTSKIVYDKAPQ